MSHPIDIPIPPRPAPSSKPPPPTFCSDSDSTRTRWPSGRTAAARPRTRRTLSSGGTSTCNSTMARRSSSPSTPSPTPRPAARSGRASCSSAAMPRATVTERSSKWTRARLGRHRHVRCSCRAELGPRRSRELHDARGRRRVRHRPAADAWITVVASRWRRVLLRQGEDRVPGLGRARPLRHGDRHGR